MEPLKPMIIMSIVELRWNLLRFGALQPASNCCNSLEVLHPGVLPLEQPLELEIGLGLVEEDHLDVDVVSRRVEEVGEERHHGLVVDVAAHDDELPPVGLVVARVSMRARLREEKKSS